MAFESLSQRLGGVFKRLRGKGKLSEADIKAAMREVRMALLEADVNYTVAKSFIAQVTERAMGHEVMESLTPAQQVIKIVNEELVALQTGHHNDGGRVGRYGQTGGLAAKQGNQLFVDDLADLLGRGQALEDLGGGRLFGARLS